ncbi:MAG: sigma-70 family RNA polymerase sigma factor, partial [Myxococcales bacterium]|nr:sigma-70 family RNA polymerase sigma factor [Myxococcales bacterium]
MRPHTCYACSARSIHVRSPVPRTTKPREGSKKPARRARADKGQPRATTATGDRGAALAPDDAAQGTARAGSPAEADDEDEAASEGELDPEATEPTGDDDIADRADGAGAEVVDDEPAEPSSRHIGSASTSSIERFDALSAYLREVQRHPLLSPEETQGLAVKFVQTQDAAAAARLVTANLRLVVKIAYEYRRAYKNIMDLIQEGNIGLMQAVKRYDPYRGVKLSSYAAWWIRAYILRFILNNWRLVKLGTTQAQRKLFFNLRKKRAELQALGIDPTNAEIAKQLDVPESEVDEMDVRLQASEKSLDAPVGDAEGRAIAKVDMMPSTGEGPESLMAEGELQALLKEKRASFRKTLEGKDKELAIFDERLVADEE